MIHGIPVAIFAMVFGRPLLRRYAPWLWGTTINPSGKPLTREQLMAREELREATKTSRKMTARQRERQDREVRELLNRNN